MGRELVRQPTKREAVNKDESIQEIVGDVACAFPRTIAGFHEYPALIGYRFTSPTRAVLIIESGPGNASMNSVVICQDQPAKFGLKLGR
jgi:hypothetical protein